MSFDAVNKPSHYAEGRQYEPIKVIEDWGLNYHLGNALKYISRAGRKDDIRQDLRKAVWYIERHIEVLEDQTCTIEQEQDDYNNDNLYRELSKMAQEDAYTFNVEVPTQDVDEEPLDHWREYVDNPHLPGYVRFTAPAPAPKWDSDDQWMLEPGAVTKALYREFYPEDVDLDDNCGWDPNSGPTC